MNSGQLGGETEGNDRAQLRNYGLRCRVRRVRPGAGVGAHLDGRPIIKYGPGAKISDQIRFDFVLIILSALARAAPLVLLQAGHFF